MKKTQIKDAIRNIKKRIVSFLSVCLVVALGLGVLFTTRYMGAGMDREYSDYFKARNLKDFEMISSHGVTDANLQKIRNVEGVTAAEGIMQANGVISFGDQRRNAVVNSITKEVSVPELTDGNMPTGKSECMIGEDFAEIEGLKVGDKIGIALRGMDALGDESPLHEKTFTITGLMHNPEQFRRKSVNTVSLPLAAFNEEATKGLYTEAYIKVNEPEKISMFSDKYYEETAGTKKALTSLEEELGADRTKDMKDEANAEIDKEWKDAQAKLDDAQTQIDEGEAELDVRLADGRKKLNNAENTLAKTVAKYKKKIRDGEKKLNLAKSKFEKIEKNLPAIKKQVKAAQKYYEKEIKAQEQRLKDLEKALADLDTIAKTLGKDSEEYKQKVKEIAEFISEPKNEEAIRKVHGFFKRDDVMKAAKLIKKQSDGKIDATGDIKKIREYNVQALIETANAISSGDYDNFIKSVKDWLKDLKKGQERYRNYEKQIKKFEANRSSYKKQIAEKEKELAAGKKKLEEEQKKYQKQIDNGWATYHSEKVKYETKLEEAKLELEENKELAEAKLKEARAEVDKMEPCRWITLDRGANAGYTAARSNISATTNAGNVFGLLFMIVTAIVCLSTLVIIIDEQKTLVGTAKAFGFHKGEILGKYLTFGSAAAITGSVLSMIIGLILSRIVQQKLAAAGLVQVGVAPTIFTPGVTIGASLIITAVAMVASVIACVDILRSPASMLMKGAVLRTNNRKRKESSRKGSLYSKLIMRNMLDDKARVAVTIAIIAFSCMLIGMGMSMKLAFSGMIDKQMGDINKYDFVMNVGDSVSEKDEMKLVGVLDEEKVPYLPATVSASLYKWNDRIEGFQMICADSSRLGEFYAVTDPTTGEALEIPDDGILIQNRMQESFGMNIGDEIPILDAALKEHNAEVKGIFRNYVGRTVVLSPAVYRSIFGKENEINSYYVRLDGADQGELKNKLLAVSEDISFDEKSDFKATLDSASQLYNIMVVVITGMAILISFMILTNLSNIFLNRRKTELSVMRVNGFSVRQAKGYLRKETIFTTGAGIVLGVLLGALATPPVMTMLQETDMELVKSFHVKAWLFAVVIETVFALIINSLVFRKVAKLNLRDIAG